MRDARKTKAQLISELKELRSQAARLEPREGQGGGTGAKPDDRGEGFRSLIDASLLGIYLHVNYRLVYVNQAFCNLLGYGAPRELLEIGDVGQLRSPEERKRLRQYFDARKAGKPAPTQYKYKAQRKDGTAIWLENFVQVVEWQSQPAVMAVAIDISERKRAEEELARFKTTLDMTADCVFMFDPQSLRFFYVNEGAVKQVEYSEQEMLNMTPLDIKPEFDERSFRKMLAPLVEGKAASHIFETVHRAKSGAEISVEVFLQYIAPAGEESRFVAIVRDITDRKKALEEVRANQQLLKTVIDTAPQFVSLKDRNNRFQIVNQAFAQAFNHDPDELIGKTLAEVADFDDAILKLSRAADQLIWDTGRPATPRKEHLNLPDGSERIGYVHKLPIRNPSGDVTGIVTINLDITELETAQEALRQSEERFRAIAHATPYPISVSVLESGEILYANAPFKELFAIGKAEPRKYRENDFYVNAADRDVLVDTVNREGRIQFFERKMKKTTGEQFWAVISSVELSYEDSRCVISGLIDVTDQKYAADELRRSEERFRAIAHATPYPIAVVALESEKFLYSNDPCKELFAIKDKDPSTYRAQDFYVNPADRQVVMETVRREGKIQFFEQEMKKLTGERFWAVSSSVAMDYEDTRCAITGLVDITDRKQAAEELRANQRLLQTIFDTVPNWLYTKDAEGRFQTVNRSMAEFFNLQPSDFVGKRFDEIITQVGGAADAVQSDQDVVRLNAMVNLPEATVVAPDGSTRIRHIVKLPLQDDAGNTIGIVGSSEDVTERKVVEQALRMSEEKFRTTLDHSPSAVTLKGVDGRFQLSNRRFNTLFGLTAQQVVGKTSRDLFTSKEADRVEVQDREVIQFGRVIETEEQFTLPDGSKYICMIARFPVTGADGVLHGIGTISTDITAQRTIEQQLRESQKMEAVGQLAGGIAHDFNNMLQVIINRALFAKEGAQPSDPLLEHLNAIVEAGEHAADLTRQLLAYSRKSVIQAVPLNLNDLTVNLMRMMGRIFGEQIELEFKPGHNLNYTKADQGMLEQVILNLCVNARDALPDGGRIQIETRNFHADTGYCTRHGWDHEGDYVTLAVQDNGIGMTPEIQERVFEPFFTSKEVGGGTGLGLAMVYGIIRQHDGRLTVESSPGEGSTFKFHLPAMEHHNGQEEQPPAAEPPRGTETILVVEDQPAVRDIISRMLTGRGYTVLTASDGEEAVSVFGDHADEIALVVLDMVLPKMSGRDALAEIRKIRPDAAVLFSTGYSADSVEKDFIGGDGPRLIQKPYASLELLETVREIIDQR